MPGDFEPEQKRYLEGLMTGLQIAKTLRPAGGNGTASLASTGPNGAAPAAEPIGPDAAALRAQDRTIKAGGKLSDPEKFKRELHPFDAYERLKEQAAKTNRRKPTIIFAGVSSACFTARQRKNPICAGCASPTAFSTTGNLPASPISPSVTPAATPM
jgi:hypothetical protein